MIRIVPDTNILISALVFGGLPLQILNLAIAGQIKLVTSSPLLGELDIKLLGKFGWTSERTALSRAKLEALCDIAVPTQTLNIVQSDPDDDRVLECALAGDADFIVTGDHHLLDLTNFRTVRIITARAFLNHFTVYS